MRSSGIELLKKEARENRIPIIQDQGLEFLLSLINENECKDILELGTAVGYSAIMMARQASDINIITLERNEDLYRQALVNIQNEGLEDQITAILTDIKDYQSDKKFDLIFVDAGKAHYMDYTEQFIGNLKQDGIMVYDNLNFHGMYLDPDSIHNRNTKSLVKKLNKFYNNVIGDERFRCEMYREIGDGILILRRRK
ncbi:MAG: O-methyltransferase [Erysipelotrichaceae bacterium]|nr:O-methyltransferase [Erysipelotrichaceae bacterium]